MDFSIWMLNRQGLQNKPIKGHEKKDDMSIISR